MGCTIRRLALVLLCLVTADAHAQSARWNPPSGPRRSRRKPPSRPPAPKPEPAPTEVSETPVGAREPDLTEVSETPVVLDSPSGAIEISGTSEATEVSETPVVRDSPELVVGAVRAVPAGLRTKIDGRLDEEHWAAAPVASGFVQQTPTPGAAAGERTEVMLAFDRTALIVGVRAYDSQPASVRGYLTPRDVESGSDWVHVAIDSYGDHRTAFEFAVNPAGVVLDAKWTHDSERNLAWNAVWAAAARRTADGWTAELEIPYRALRFAAAGDGVDRPWGLQVWRVVARTGEVSYWQDTPETSGRFVSHFGELHGVEGASRDHAVELRQYVVAGGTRGAGAVDYELRTGLDARYAITDDFTLDLSVRPDFGQVELDPAEANLTAFELFRDEHREFFVEGSELLDFPLNAYAPDRVFYSRRIGGPPRGLVDAPDGAEVATPPATNVAAAGKLTGKTASGWGIAVLDAVTEEALATITTGDGATSTAVAAPRTNYLVVTAQRDANAGRTAVRFTGASVLRDAEANPTLVGAATSGGLSLDHVAADGAYALRLVAVGSVVQGDPAAIARIQRAPAHYFHRPGTRHLRYRPAATALGGGGAELWLSKTGGDPWLFTVYGFGRTPGLELNEAGFLGQADRAGTGGWITYRHVEPGPLVRRYTVTAAFDYAATFGGETVEATSRLGVAAQLTNFWLVRAGVLYRPPVLDTTALRGGPALAAPPITGGWLSAASDARKAAQLTAQLDYAADPLGGSTLATRTALQLQPSPSLELRVGVAYDRARDRAHFVGAVGDGAPVYVVGALDARSYGIELRGRWMLTPDVGVQLFAQPFITVAELDDFRSVADPLAPWYSGDQLEPYALGADPSFQARELRVNVLASWEYRPGSMVYVAWSQTRAEVLTGDAFLPFADFGAVFRAPGEDTVLVKLTGLFSM